MRVVIVVKPAGTPSTAGTPNEVTLSTKAMAAAPARTGRSSGSVTVRKAVRASAPEARAARSRSGSARVARPATDDEVHDRAPPPRRGRRRCRAGRRAPAAAKPSRSSTTPARSVGVQPAHGRHVAGHDERDEHGAARRPRRPGTRRALGEDRHAAAEATASSVARQARPQRAGDGGPGRGHGRDERREAVLEGRSQQRQQRHGHQQGARQEQARQGQQRRGATTRRAHRSRLRGWHARAGPGDPPSSADPTRTWPSVRQSPKMAR